jgi:CHAT domain-containing protein/uncharacterized protein HemY
MIIRKMAVCFVLIWAGILPLCAQQSGSPIATYYPQAAAEAQAKLDKLQTELKAAQAAGDHGGEAKVLRSIGLAYSSLGEKQKALNFFDQALVAFRAVGDDGGEANTLTAIGVVYSYLDEKQKALDSYSQALPLCRARDDRACEVFALYKIADIYSNLGDKEKALDYFNQSLPPLRAMGTPSGEAVTLVSIGKIFSALGEEQKALDTFNQALQTHRAAGDHKGEVATLIMIGDFYFDAGERQKALGFYTQALAAHRAAGNREGEAGTLGSIGLVYDALGQQQMALDSYNRALAIFRAIADRDGEARALIAIGGFYLSLGEKQKALDFYNQALAILRELSDRGGEARTLIGIGSVYFELGDRQKALDLYNQALLIATALRFRSSEAYALINIGNVYSVRGQQQKALDFSDQALPIFRAAGDREGEAYTLNTIGLAYSALGEPQKALEFFDQALPIATTVSDPLLESLILRNLMSNQRQAQPALATFYGKRAVNLLQQVRGNIQSLDMQLQSSFLASKWLYYHDLADLLIAQGRLPEAEQVLDLFKQQEYTDYVRGSADTLSLTLTPEEQQAEADYQKSTAQLVSLGHQWAQLKAISSRTPEQEQLYQQLSDELDAASKGLNDYYAHLYKLFGAGNDANRRVADVKGDVSLLKQQIASMPNTVALYTMTTGDRYRVIVITGMMMVAREFAISDKELNQKVAAFQQVLRSPSNDPKPLAQDLYKILIGPVQADLDQAHAETLVWSLDGVLRYVPMAALNDGRQYLVEKYNTVTITPASIPHLSEKPDVSGLSAVAMGISRKYEDGLNPLPSVVGELDDIVKDPQIEAAHGVLPGTILLNGDFTERAMENQLSRQHPVVHIASHFVFKPGDDSQSYLLLAGKDKDSEGFHLTVADFRDDQKLSLDDTDLLTLSACETGMEGTASNGREVDGLGTTAQLKGAKSVISSLWSVNDASTGLLMGDFYKRWADGAGKVMKVEALRQAQLDLLLGKVTPEGNSGGRGFSSEGPASQAPKGYAHPYYWAPFVLMGNWK